MSQCSRENDGYGFAAFALCAALPFLLVGFFSGDEFLIRFFMDDSFYYLQTAWNFTTSGRISFDGVNWTNGFHPLFFFVASFFTWIFPKHLLLPVFFLLHVVLIFTAIIFCVQKIGKVLDNQQKKMVFLGFSLFPFFFFMWVSCGLEAGLVILVTVLFFLAWVQAEQAQFANTGQNLRLGAGMTCLMLSRLDLIIVLSPFVLFICWRFFQKKSVMRLGHAAALFILPLIFGGLYLAVNLVFTGHLMPVSGMAKKLVLAEPFWQSWRDLTGGNALGTVSASLPLTGSLAVFICASIPGIRSRLSATYLRGVLLCNLGVVFFYLYLFFFAWQFFGWYLAYPAAVLLITGVVLTGELIVPLLFSGRRQPLGLWILGAALFFNVAANSYFLIRLVPNNVSNHLLKIAREVDRLSGADAVIGTFDAGIVGFFARGRVINLDGLANDFDFLENYLVPGRLQEYFTRQGVTHFLVLGDHLTNLRQVREGDYAAGIFRKDPRIRLTRENELFRYAIPDSFSVYLFRLK